MGAEKRNCTLGPLYQASILGCPYLCFGRRGHLNFATLELLDSEDIGAKTEEFLVQREH